jgi:hypothetical protein
MIYYKPCTQDQQAEGVMARIAQHEASEIEAAKKVAAEAKTLMQLRQSQAVLTAGLGSSDRKQGFISVKPP